MEVRLIHITAELPPTVGGVADYTSILSNQLVGKESAIDVVLLHAGKELTDSNDLSFPVVDCSGQQSAAVLEDTLQQLIVEDSESVVVLLEYSGYGYSEDGAPLWLSRGLSRACGSERVFLITMFHELYAKGPPWTKAFWLSPLQRLSAAWLARVSSGIVTNRFSAAPWLRRYRASEDVPITVQPVFSNVGEPDTLPAFEERDRNTVLFGGGGRKSLVYDEHREVLRSLINQVEFSAVLDIGPTADSAPFEASWSQPLGVLPEDEISDRLFNVSLGLLSYPGSRLGKSGVAAAFAAHGVPFLLFDEEASAGDTDPYVEGRHFWRANAVREDRSRLFDERLAEMSRSIRSLYQERLHSKHAARCFLDLIQKVAPMSAGTTTSPPLE